MIELGRAVEIVSGILPRMRRFPRGSSAQVATLAECGKLLADRCQTEQQAADFSREFSNRQTGWHSTAEFQEWLDSRSSDIPAGDLRMYAGCAHNSIIEPLRCGDKFIGWCGQPFPAHLIAQASNPNLTLLEQAELGRACVAHHQWAEAEAAREITDLAPDQRAALEAYARREFRAFLGDPQSSLSTLSVALTYTPSTTTPLWAMCLALDEWRKSCV